MSAYVEECRREWKRLGVPDLLADEMAADLEADLAEAQTEGVAADEILGESDPRRFAAAWASERGLVAEQQPRKSRKRLWIVLAVVSALLLVFLFLGVALAAWVATPKMRVHILRPVTVASVRPIHSGRVPTLVGLGACHAKRIALAAGFKVGRIPTHRCDAIVVAQVPAPGTIFPRHRPRPTLTLRLDRG